MRWKYETPKEKFKRLKTWHKWFAWYPVSYDGVTYWLETIERSRDQFLFDTYISGYGIWSYRPLSSKIKFKLWEKETE